MLVTEINPGDAGLASPLRVTDFIEGEAEFAVIPSLFMVELDVRNECEHEVQNAEAHRRAQHARVTLLEDEQGPSRGEEAAAEIESEFGK